MPKRAFMVINPVARTPPSPDRLATAPAWLRLRGWTVHEQRTEYAGHAIALARQAAADGFDAVIAVGGDGTVNEVINGMAGSDTAMAVIPAGTANVWAHEVRMPRHPAAVARLLDQGVVRQIDLGVMNGRYFLLMASLGVDSIVVSAIPPWAKRTFGRFAYVTQGFREAVTFPAVPARVRVDGEVMEVDLLMVVVGNTRSYGGVLKITNLAIADDGQLDMVVYNGSGVGRTFNYMARTFIGRHVRAPGATYRSARVIEIDTAVPLPVQVDGDLAGQTPARFGIAPGALRVIVPPLLHSPLFTRGPIILGERADQTSQAGEELAAGEQSSGVASAGSAFRDPP